MLSLNQGYRHVDTHEFWYPGKMTDINEWINWQQCHLFVKSYSGDFVIWSWRRTIIWTRRNLIESLFIVNSKKKDVEA